MANVRKPIIENPVYCEILFKLGVHKYYVNQFVNQFIKTLEDRKPYKKQPVLIRQMAFLEKEGYLLSTKKDDKGKTLDKNKKLYYINFDKIIEAFLDYCIINFKELLDRGEIEDEEYKRKTQELRSKRFRDDSKTNIIIRFMFNNFVEMIRQTNKFNLSKITLKNMFNSIIHTGHIEDMIRQELIDRVEKEDIPIKEGSKSKSVEQLVIKRELLDDYGFFTYFLDTIKTDTCIDSYMQNEFPISISRHLIEGFNEETSSFYNLHTRF